MRLKTPDTLAITYIHGKKDCCSMIQPSPFVHLMYHVLCAALQFIILPPVFSALRRSDQTRVSTSISITSPSLSSAHINHCNSSVMSSLTLDLDRFGPELLLSILVRYAALVKSLEFSNDGRFRDMSRLCLSLSKLGRGRSILSRGEGECSLRVEKGAKGGCCRCAAPEPYSTDSRLVSAAGPNARSSDVRWLWTSAVPSLP